jgi:hypothetical protein
VPDYSDLLLQQHCRHHQNSGIAMTDIPTELLQEVFKQIKQSLASRLRAHSRKPDQPGRFPWYLGHVCSRWRSLFLSMRSTFWNRIDIELWHDDYSGEEESRESEIVAFFLDRTRGAPFSFSFGTIRRNLHAEQEPYNIPLAILARLVVHSEQWKEVFFELSSSEVGCLCAAKGLLPLLTKLELVVNKDADYEPTQNMTSDVFEDAPLLTQIMLCDHSTQRFKVNSSPLTIVYLVYLTHHKNIRAVLRESIDLVDLNISETRVENLHIEGGELIHLPRLERLYIDVVPLLTILETPTLKHLAIDHWRDGGTLSSHFAELDETRVIIAFLCRLGIKLDTLMLFGGHAIHVREILPSIPEVDTLALRGVKGMAYVFEWLAKIETQELPFTNLFVTWPFRMYDEDLYRTEVDALHDMIVRRNPTGEGCPSPQEIVIQSNGSDSLAVHLESLCRARGIRFVFGHETSTRSWPLKFGISIRAYTYRR